MGKIWKARSNRFTVPVGYVNGLHLYSAVLHWPCTKCFIIGLTFTHSHPVTSSCHARCCQTHWRQVGVQCLAQGHFDMLDSWSRDQTANLTVTGQPALPTELQPPYVVYFGFKVKWHQKDGSLNRANELNVFCILASTFFSPSHVSHAVPEPRVSLSHFQSHFTPQLWIPTQSCQQFISHQKTLKPLYLPVLTISSSQTKRQE